MVKILDINDMISECKAQTHLFVTANFVSVWAQLSKFERQRALLLNSGQIMKKQVFIFSNLLTIQQTSTLCNILYFNNTWTKIQLQSHPVNMQPDKFKCCSQWPITTHDLQDAEYIRWKPPLNNGALLYPRPTKLEGGYTGFTLSVRPSVRLSIRPSVCRQHGFRSISQVCFGMSISNFICMLMVAIGRSLLIFSDVTFKMAAWRPYWIFGFPDSNFTLALNINFKLQRHNINVYG